MTTERACDAAGSKDTMAALLSHVAMIARPGEGCPQILFAVALLAHAEWIDGRLRVELVAEHGATRLDVFTEHAGVRERVLPSTSFPVSLEEFRRAARDCPELVAPLVVSREADDRVVLEHERHAASGTAPPPPQFEVAEESMLFDRPTVKRKNPLAPEAFRSGQSKRFE